MRIVFIFLVYIFFCFSVIAENISFDNLMKRNDLFYKKFTDTPFTGEIKQGQEQGFIQEGYL